MNEHAEEMIDELTERQIQCKKIRGLVAEEPKENLAHLQLQIYEGVNR